MNTKHSFWNRLLAALLLAVMLVTQTTTAFAAVEGTEPTEPNTIQVQPAATSTENAEEGTDTTDDESPSEGPQTALQTVFTLEELLQAIEQAEAGATIGVGCEIRCMEDVSLGSPDKVITIKRIAPEGHVAFCSDYGTGNAMIQNIIFDGAEIESSYSFVICNVPGDFNNCSFVNCFGGNGAGLYLTGRNVTLDDCKFENNRGQMGAHLRIDCGNVTMENCTFTGGTATIKGGAIMNMADSLTMTGCTIKDNTSTQHGGGIWNNKNMSISQCKIYNNTSNGEADDLVNGRWGQLALFDDHDALVALYESEGLTPNKWTVDTFFEDTDIDKTEPYMVFSMTFTTDDPEPSPEPEPTPEPTPEPEPVIIYKTHVVEKLVKEPEAKPATITNGKAVLKAPDADFWTGYETGHGGAAGTVTRADLAALMLSMMDDESREHYYTETTPFDDVAPGAWYAPAIGTASNAGFMVGCGLGAFHPERKLTWGELLTVFARFTEEETPPEVYTGSHWAKDAVNTGISLEWISGGIDPGDAVTTGDLTELVQSVFKWAEKS